MGRTNITKAANAASRRICTPRYASAARIRLFRSENPAYADGEQLRDFVWVGDCVDVALWALKDQSAASGLYNVGSGVARSFYDKARIMFAELGVDPKIEFIDLPANLKGKYQYYTCASLDKLRAAGYNQSMTSLENGLRKYVQGYLERTGSFLLRLPIRRAT